MSSSGVNSERRAIASNPEATGDDDSVLDEAAMETGTD